MKIVVAITGASGVIYGIRLLEHLKKSHIDVEVVVSHNAWKIICYETEIKKGDLANLASHVYSEDDMESPLASGSHYYDAMVICPCSLNTMAAIANGLSSNLITRAATCCMKEGRKLILTPRETPLDLTSLKNMVLLKTSGAILLPAMPAFYHIPKDIDDMVNFIVGKIFDQLTISHSLYKKWE